MAQASEVHAGSAYTFDPFTRHQFYTDVNWTLIDRAVALVDDAHPRGDTLRIVELASGTGAITEQILDALADRGRPARVIGVEPSLDAIHVAERRLAGRPVSFVQGDAADLARAIGKANAVFFCNAIHLVPDKDAAAATIANVLEPGGFFATNSSFYTGAYAPGTERFYHLWTRRALGWLRTHHPDIRPSHHGKTMAMQWLSPADYVAVLERQGMEIALMEEQRVLMPLRAWQDIGRYSLFIEGALPGVPIPVGADALEAGAAQAFEELDLDTVPRNWLQLVGRRVR
ncbi:MAG TPA: class I SAM-dependent methyltransferase [Ktedonobacterales bacterium]